MHQQSIESILADLPQYTLRYYDRVGSTNDVAAQWADQGAPDLALVVADEQTRGRGRAGRHWFTPPASGLAFSLVLYPQNREPLAVQQYTALGSLAVQRVLKRRYSLPAQIKWPNDVLVAGSKVAGVLAEMHWIGEKPVCAILGIGINIAPPSIDPLAQIGAAMDLPAICVQDLLGGPVNRFEILHEVLNEFLDLRGQLGTKAFIQAWESALAFRDEWVYIYEESVNGPSSDNSPSQLIKEGRVLGLAENGELLLRSRSGEIENIHIGQIHLRPTKEQTSCA